MSQPLGWLANFTNQVCQAIEHLGEPLPVGCHVHLDCDTWEVSIFVASTEIVGGQHDGERVASNFVVDVLKLLMVFDDVESSSWQAQRYAEDDDLGPHLSVIGAFEGHSIWLRILSEVPDQLPAGRIADVIQNRIIDTW